MPSPLRDVKALSDWIELDYYRRPRRLRRFRALLAWAVLLSGAGALALLTWLGQPSIYQAGPVSTAHHMFNNDCGKCHTESFQPVNRLWPGNAPLRSVMDQACQQCHEGAVHNVHQARQPNCASCHQEHRGRPSLTQVASTQCTQCHADLQRKDGSPGRVLPVSSFAGHHPEFALWRDGEPQDPGRLRFNHRVHLQEEGVPGHDGQREKLTCVSCHQFDAQRQYPLPINYEQHCAGCHPLSVLVVGEWPDESTGEAAAQFRQLPAPHKQPVEVRAALRERYLQFVRQCPAVLDNKESDLPGYPLPGARRRPTVPSFQPGPWVENQLQQVERLLFQGAGGCRYCHEPKEPGTVVLPPRLPEYELTNLPRRWYRRSRFSHDSHQMLRCTECHAATESQHSSDVLLPKIGTCQQCHNPQVGVRSDCINCHRYHDRSREQAGKGVLTIADCLGNPGATSK